MVKNRRIICRTLVLLLAVILTVLFPFDNQNVMTVNAAKNNTVKVTIVKPATKTFVLPKGKTYSLKTKITGTSNKKLIYKSNKPAVVKVSSKGKLKALKKGSAKITVSVKSNPKVKVTLNVKVGTRVKTVKLNKKSITLKQGNKYKLKATVTPKNATLKKVSYTSNKTSIVKVNKTGTVTAVAAGTAKITVMATDGSGKKATCIVKVKKQTTANAENTAKPSTDGSKPSTDGSEPSTEEKESSTDGSEPSTEGNEPSTEEKEPSTEGNEPSTEEPPVDDNQISGEINIPGIESDNQLVGATMPYTRYDSDEAVLGGGALIERSDGFAKNEIASQASEQSYVKLPGNGSYAEWTMTTTGNGVTIRFTLPDTPDGLGQEGSLDVYVNGNKVKTVELTSYYMWQYFTSGEPSDTDNGGAPCFAFDETHFRLKESLKAGDKIRIQSSGANNLEYGVDFLEIEETGDAILQPADSYSVVDYGAVPDDGLDDLAAIEACVAAADAAGKDVYFPEGTYHIDKIWNVYGSDIMITGAGMWYTNIQFTNSGSGMGGISGGWGQWGSNDGYCTNVEFCNMYINSNLSSRYGQEAVYKCFMDVWTGNSIIHDIWEEHFECGFWFGDYNGKMDYSDNVKVINCRIRNNLADGVNFCEGTSNAAVYNCNIRNNGDDGLAMWNNSAMDAKDEENNVFCYNTIELIWRAGGIAIYGGNGHKIYNNYIADTFMSAGIHLNTTFPGYKFENTDGIEFVNNVIVRSGTSSDCWNEEFGAVDIKGEVKNITFTNTSIYDAQHEGIRIWDNPTGIVFKNTKVYGTGVDGQTPNYSADPHKGALLKFSKYTVSVPVTFDGMEFANIAYTENGGVYGSLTDCTIKDWINLGNDYSYTIPQGGAVGSIHTDHRNGGNYISTKPTDGTSTSSNGCDLVITSLELVPANAKAGDEVAIKAVIKNQGNEASPEGIKHGLAISVGSKNFASPTIWCDLHFSSIPAGGTVTLTTNGGQEGKATWTAQSGTVAIYAIIDDQYLIAETNERNNEASFMCTFNGSGNTITNMVVTNPN